MLRIIVILAITLLPQLLTAQPVLPGQDIVVWDTTGRIRYHDHGPPNIALNSQGQYLILFGSRAQWFDASFERVGNVIRLPLENFTGFHLLGRYSVAMTYPWFRYLVRYESSCYTGMGILYKYNFYKHDATGKFKFSDVVYESFACGEFDASSSDFPIFDQCLSVGNQILYLYLSEVTYNQHMGDQYTRSLKISSARLKAINKWTGETSEIRSSSERLGINIDRNTSAFPNMRMTGIHGNEFLLRTQHAVKVDTLITGVYSSCEIFDATLQSTGSEILFDTLSVADSRRFEEVLLTDNKIIVLYRYPGDDSVFANIFSRAGTTEQLHKYTGIRPDTLKSNNFLSWTPRFAAKTTESNSIVVLWDERIASDDPDIFVQAFDESMNPISDVKRVNTDTSRNNYDSDFVLKGDTIIVCWARSGAGEYTAIVGKQFTLDQVTPVNAVPQPSALAIRSIYPQPASEYAHFDVSMRNATGMATLAVYSILGVQVSQQQIQHDGIIQLDVHSMPRGLYYASLSDGVHESSRMFVVRR